MDVVQVPPRLGVFRWPLQRRIFLLAETNPTRLDDAFVIYCFDCDSNPKKGVVLIRSHDSQGFRKYLTVWANGPYSPPKYELTVRYFDPNLPLVSVDSIASLVDEYDKREPYSPGDAIKMGIFWRNRTIGPDTSTAWKETAGETVRYRLRDQTLTDETYSREVAKMNLVWKKPKKSKFGITIFPAIRKAKEQVIGGQMSPYILPLQHVLPCIAKACLSELFLTRFWGQEIADNGGHCQRDKENSWGGFIEYRKYHWTAYVDKDKDYSDPLPN